jgi:hypothetical protein
MTGGKISRAELAVYIQTNNFRRGQDRIGIEVYRAEQGKRSKLELTIAAGSAHVYDLLKGRKRIQSWEIAS